METSVSPCTVAEHLESVLTFPNGDIRMIWTGWGSCNQYTPQTLNPKPGWGSCKHCDFKLGCQRSLAGLEREIQYDI
jgi:hypothetical protein